MFRPLLTSMLLSLAALSLPACGGGGGGVGLTLTPNIESAPVDWARSGTVSESGLALSNVSPSMGDDGNNDGAQGILTFDLRDIPRGADLTAAELSMVLTGHIGNPGGLGRLGYDVIELGPNLDRTDWIRQFVQPHDGTITNDANQPPVNVSILDVVQAALDAGRTELTLRLRFLIDSDHDNRLDSVQLVSSRFRDGADPILLITWR